MRTGRRTFLQATGAAALAAGAGSTSAPAAGAESQHARHSREPGGPRRIDTHHHAVPDAMREWAVEQGLLPPEGGPSWAEWTLESTLETMDANGIAAGVASAPVPAEAFHDPKLAREGVRVCNESLAELVAGHPDRFGFFANVAMTHPELAVRQAHHALDELGADGVIMMNSAGGRYLGDPEFDRVFDALNERGAVIFTHPGELPKGGGGIPGIEDYALDYMLDTARTAVNLVVSGTLERCPRLSVILSHAGGFLPYVAGRLESAVRQGDMEGPEDYRPWLRRFHYDTAMPMSPYATPSLLAAVGADRVLYGSDWPARPGPEVGVVTRELDRDPALDAHARQCVDRDNALRLLPGLARRLRG